MVREDRRNPYVILGVAFGASAAEARSGFAKMTRRLRNTKGAIYGQEDLTWALHQVEQVLEHPELAFTVYRVPADPVALGSPSEGRFNPSAHRLDRRTQPPTQADWESVRKAAVAKRLAHELHAWAAARIAENPYLSRRE
jgi:hypothetical protein